MLQEVQVFCDVVLCHYKRLEYSTPLREPQISHIILQLAQ